MKKIIYAIVVILVVIQFIPTQINVQSTDMKNDISTLYTVPDDVKEILKTSCNDCHSNYTELPSYAKFQPVKMYLARHVKNGKKHLNFSEFATYDAKRQQKKLDEIAEEVEEHNMPLSSYTLIHTDAKLDDAKIQVLKSWVEGIQQNITVVSDSVSIN
ncbi:MAG: heme-binding domain-containing protein [Chitinophagales bacterium]|nr:heme-binding domain-containing protein [Chitinophagales bacterium]